MSELRDGVLETRIGDARDDKFVPTVIALSEKEDGDIEKTAMMIDPSMMCSDASPILKMVVKSLLKKANAFAFMLCAEAYCVNGSPDVVRQLQSGKKIEEIEGCETIMTFYYEGIEREDLPTVVERKGYSIIYGYNNQIESFEEKMQEAINTDDSFDGWLDRDDHPVMQSFDA